MCVGQGKECGSAAINSIRLRADLFEVQLREVCQYVEASRGRGPAICEAGRPVGDSTVFRVPDAQQHQRSIIRGAVRSLQQGSLMTCSTLSKSESGLS